MMWGAGKFSAWRSGPRLFGECGVIDFAGSGTVHMTGGVAALVACIMIGPRKGFPDNLPEGQPVFQRARRAGAPFLGDESRRRRGCDVDIPWRRVATPPRLRRENCVETSRGDAAG